MPSELVAVASAFGGVILGGLINYLATRSAKNREWELALARDQISIRQKLFAEFLAEAQCLVVSAMQEKSSDLAKLNPLSTKFAEISLVCTPPVVAGARAITDYALTCHVADSTKKEDNFFALKEEFIGVARGEIASFRSI